ncbi:4'-phosphopantetheinyl transferase family protein [Fodinibacter luteus]|uniref:4'-phosphopantetheinyl transferase family protein n=1 Tax=Fodinibacter luteus TaxID=552064 RepID=UPI0031ED9FDB
MDAVAGPGARPRGPASWRLASCATSDPADPSSLHPEEALLVAGARPDRVVEFATGRHCARTALRQLGVDDAAHPVLADPRGAPSWPPGVVGSITHTSGWTGAVAARRGGRGGIASLGLDAEPAAALPPGVLEVVATDRERAALDRLGGVDGSVPWGAVLFAAKEAAYKAWYPLTGVVLHHGQVEVELSTGGRFRAQVSSTGVGSGAARRLVRGRWRLGPTAVVTLGVVSAPWSGPG